jgi:peptidoglycan-N-acetylglucosamine deacetylase
MRITTGACLSVLWTVLPAPPLQAHQDCTATNTLGVARTIEVDSVGGPWFGEPFGDRNFLAPGEVVLTFDDGPVPRTTRPILEALAAECVKATFFVLGEMATAHPELVREIGAQGHTIGTHTWSHANLKRLSQENMKAQIESGFTAVEKAAGHPIAPFFRYPYLSHSEVATAYLQSRNIAQFAIDIDSFDWRTRNAQRVVTRVMAGLGHRGRGIILLHDIHPSTATAVPSLLALLKANHYKVVHLKPKTAAETIAAYQAPLKEHQDAPTRRRVVHAKRPPTSWTWPW